MQHIDKLQNTLVDYTIKKKNIRSKVFEKIYLDLQQDEVELADPTFRKLFNKAYKDLVSTFNQSTLRRTTTSQAAKNILLGLETNFNFSLFKGKL